jgi:hypothetical protein
MKRSLDVKKLRVALSSDRFEWRKHMLQRLAERDISQEYVLKVLFIGERIEDYPDDKPYPSALFLGWIKNRPMHVVAALDEDNNWAYIITAYEPSLEFFEPDYKTRRE